ncbi:MAG: hypothetical protein NT031_10735 [Planctomycetota bacterium]|nr:hypothetical protein [Planctomycetota bacterium]
MGEKLDNLEEFRPEGMAGRILGMGDVVELAKKAQGQFDEEQAAKMQAKMAKGLFTLDDFLEQMGKVRKMGPLKDILKLIPGMGGMMDELAGSEDEFSRMEGIIHSMTAEERDDPSILEASRRRRIARGSGCEPQEMTANMMKTAAGMGGKDRMKLLQQVGQASMSGQTPRFKTKQRSKRLSKKEREKKRKNRKKK